MDAVPNSTGVVSGQGVGTDADLRRRVPPCNATLTGPVSAPVTIRWDRWGIPHIRARTNYDLRYGLGYATAQEHFWRLELCRRQARGTLAAVLGRGALATDRTARLIGLGRHADETWQREPEPVVEALRGLADGINAWREHAIRHKVLPMEFDLLGFEPEPWTPADGVAVWKGRWWMLTGRLDNIALAEAARRYLPPELLPAFMATELGEETIIPEPWALSPPSTVHRPPSPPVPGGSDTGEGSNNWVVAGSRTTTGYPVLCSDPHNPFTQPSQWFEAQLTLEDGSLDTAGAVYIGAPAVYFGRNRRVAWGFTNHVAPQRDLYLEELDPHNPDHYLEQGQSRPFAMDRQTIEIRGEAPEVLEVRRTVRGPVVDALLPRLDSDGDTAGPVTLRWAGTEVDTGLAGLMGLNAARTASEAVEAMSRWVSPVANLLVADVENRLAYHVVGKVPRRAEAARRYRRASDPADAWDGFIPYEQLPQQADPPHGWIASANQPPWRVDPPGLSYVGGGAWADGGRMRRIRTHLLSTEKHTPEALGAFQGDVVSERAAALLPVVLPLVGSAARGLLDGWDGSFTEDSIAATVWTAFWDNWLRRVAAARFPGQLVSLVAAQGGSVARDLLQGRDTNPSWLGGRSLAAEVSATMDAALSWLTERFGAGHDAWRWGRVHTVTWSHAIPDSGPPDLKQAAAVLNVGPFPTTGGGNTVRAAGHPGVPYRALSGASYRLVADLSPAAGFWTVNTTGNSGHPGSPHYADQSPLWLGDQYHPFPLGEFEAEGVTTIAPRLTAGSEGAAGQA